MSKKCDICGSFLPDEEQVCFYCGHSFEIEVVEEKENEEMVEEKDVEEETVTASEPVNISRYLLVFIGIAFILFWIIFFGRIFFDAFKNLW